MSLHKLGVTTRDAFDLLKAKGVPNPQNGNLRYHEFFDIQPYAQAGQAAINFFGRNPSGISPDDCNLLTGSPELPSSQAFVACAASVHFVPGADRTAYGAGGTAAAIDDYLIVEESGRVVFKVGTKDDYVENGPLHRFPPATQIAAALAVSDSSTAAAGQRTLIQLPRIEGDLYTFTPKVIMPGDRFVFNAVWQAAVPVTAAGKINGRLYGFLIDIR